MIDLERLDGLPHVTLIRRFYNPELLREACMRVIATGRLFATDNGGRELFEWTPEDQLDLWEWCLVHLGDGKVVAPYVIRYPSGVEVKPHSDSGAMRLVALALASGAGGALLCGGTEVPLEVGDAVVFNDKVPHAVTRIVGGERWTLTLGVQP